MKDIEKSIKAKLNEIEQTENVRIIIAAKSGTRGIYSLPVGRNATRSGARRESEK